MIENTRQTSFLPPVERAREVIARCARQYRADRVILAVSGGTDSIVAADLMCRLGPEYGLEPDAIMHIHTGASIPQTRLAARVLADVHGIGWIQQGYRNQRDSLAARILKHGWPGRYPGSPAHGGHGLEWANRKDKPMDETYVRIAGKQIWVSGARRLESKARQGNVPDSGVKKDKPRRVWLSPICGWTSSEKQDYIRDRGLPVPETYLILGFSGECVGCAYDETGLLTRIDILSPELAHALRTLAVWLYMRVRRGDVELEPKRLCWGWTPADDDRDDDQTTLAEDDETAKAMIGCDEESCATRERPAWILDLPESQLIDRTDVVAAWNDRRHDVTARFSHIGTADDAGDRAIADGGTNQ